MENKQIKKSFNNLQVVGTLAEMNLEYIENNKIELEVNGTKQEVVCNSIKKKEFKNPMFLVDVAPVDEDGKVRYESSVGIEGFGANSKTVVDGKIVENSRFKELETIMNKYVSKKDAKEGETPTRVNVTGSLSVNEYVNKQTYDFKSIPQVMMYKMTSTGVPEYDIAEGNISGIIRKFTDELKGGESEELTGRMKVEFYIFDKDGKTQPVNLIVESDLVEAVKDAYQPTDSVTFYYDILTKTVGARKNNNQSAFGRREQNTVSGFQITEFSIFKGDLPFEAENDRYVPVELMQEAMKAREIMIEQKIKEAKEKESKPSGSTSNGTSRGGLGVTRTPKTTKKEEQEAPKDASNFF